MLIGLSRIRRRPTGLQYFQESAPFQFQEPGLCACVWVGGSGGSGGVYENTHVSAHVYDSSFPIISQKVL